MIDMKPNELVKLLKRRGCIEVRQRGSHIVIRCTECQTVVAMHKGSDIPTGTLKSIERDLAPCLGEGWVKKG